VCDMAHRSDVGCVDEIDGEGQLRIDRSGGGGGGGHERRHNRRRIKHFITLEAAFVRQSLFRRKSGERTLSIGLLGQRIENSPARVSHFGCNGDIDCSIRFVIAK
jgi:hypothetical protein